MRRASIPTVLALAAVAAGQSPAPLGFSDVTASAAISFSRNNGAAGDKWFPEQIGGGVAVLDLGQDGWPDLLFVNGKDWRPRGSRSLPGLYRNNRDGTFVDVVVGSGLEAREMYAMGAAVADYDNDGRDDVYITALDGDRLFHNEGGGTFADVTERAGIRNADFAVSAAWLDYDRDGHVDLFVGNYVRWSPETDVRCSFDGQTKAYCGPDVYSGVPPKLFRNRGDGRFEDVTERAGLNDTTCKALGLAVLDYDGDAWPDLFVANDRVPNRLFRNSGRGTFADEGLLAGVALSESGGARAGMGTDAGDYDRSGRPHLLVGNFQREMLGLFHNENGRLFVDEAPRSTVGRASLWSVTWGVFFFDYDLDGWPDIFAANGGTEESEALRDPQARYRQPPVLLRNRGDRSFEDVSRAVGEAFSRPLLARGAAYADLDRDGDLDVVIAGVEGRPHVYRNDGGNRNNWLRVRAVGAQSNRSGIGAVVRVTSASGTQWQTVHSGSSYGSQSELVLTFGLLRDPRVRTLEVAWPSGKRQRFENVAANRSVVVDERLGLSAEPARPPASPAAAAPPRSTP